MPVSANKFSSSAMRRQSIWIFSAIGVVILLALSASFMFSTYLNGPGKTSARSLDTGWSYFQDGDFQSIPTLPCTLETTEEPLLLRHSLTEQELHTEYLLTFRTRYASIRVWADDALIYEAAQGAEHALGSMWHFIPMSDCAGAGEITVELQTYGGGSYELESVLLDTPGAIKFTLIHDNAGPIFFGSICLLLTLIMLFCAVVLARWKSRTYLPLISLVMFVLLSGLWILLDSKVTTIAGGPVVITPFLTL